MTETCGCPVTGTGACSCGNGHPPAVTNPPDLAEIAYRVNDFAGFRRALLTGLPGEQQLTGWSPGPADLGQQVLEWWAYLADILTFYNERIANNDYLRPAAAQQQAAQSVTGLVRLLGYPTRPAITATGYIAAIRSATAPRERLVIPDGMQITSTPTAGLLAQLFETAAAEFDGPSVVPLGLTPLPGLFQPADYQPGGPPPAEPKTSDAAASAGGAEDKDRSVLLAGRVTIQPDGSLLLVSRTWDGASDGWTVATVSSARTETAPDGGANTRVVLQSDNWAGISPPADKATEPAPSTPPAQPAEPAAGAYRLQKATATALLWTLPDNPPAKSLPAKLGGLLLAPVKLLWTGLTRLGGGLLNLAKALWKWVTRAKPAAPAGGAPIAAQPAVTVQLATLVRGIAPGDNILVSPAEGKPILAQVTGYQEQLEPVVPVPGSVTSALVPRSALTLRTAKDDSASLSSAVSGKAMASTTVQYGFRDVGTLIPTPRAWLHKLAEVDLTSIQPDVTVPSSGNVALEDATGTGVLVTAAGAGGSIRLEPAASAPQTFDPPLQAPIQLLANLVPVSRGTTVSAEILGDGDPTVANQTFILQHSPLTYLPPATPGGAPRSELGVSVDGVPWSEVAAFADESGTATVYVVSLLADGRIQVCFGDGLDGARLPRGVGNVVASYRYGAAALPPPRGRLSTVLQPQPNLATVRSPLQLVPGTSAEPATLTAENAPPTVVLLGAAVSPGDCEQIAAEQEGVTRVRGYWTWDQDRRSPGIALYTDAAAAEPDVRKLLPATTWRIPVTVAVAQPAYLSISGELHLVGKTPAAEQQAIEKAAAKALIDPAAGLFSPQRMAIGQRLYRSQVENALSVAGVRAVLELRIERIEPAPAPAGGTPASPAADDNPGPAGGTALSFDAKVDEYFQAREDDLHICVVPDG